MKHSGVAVLASIAMCVQNAGVGLAFGWGLVHGAGPAILVMFVPLALGLTALWAGYVFLSRRNMRGAPVIFTTYALGLLLLNELLLPMTPLKAWRANGLLKRSRCRTSAMRCFCPRAETRSAFGSHSRRASPKRLSAACMRPPLGRQLLTRCNSIKGTRA